MPSCGGDKLFPRAGLSNDFFEIGKPWRYDEMVEIFLSKTKVLVVLILPKMCLTLLFMQ
jgi:hypothetical protein